METAAKTVDEAVAEIMRISRSLPPRPEIEEVEAAKTLIRSVEKEDQLRLEAIAMQSKGAEVPEELFFVLQEMQRGLVLFQSKEQKEEATKLLGLENLHCLFDDLIQRASQCVSSPSGRSSSSRSTSLFSDKSSSVSSTITNSSTATTANCASAFKSDYLNSKSLYLEKEPGRSFQPLSKDDSFLKKAKTTFYADGFRTGSPLPIVDSTLKLILSSERSRQIQFRNGHNYNVMNNMRSQPQSQSFTFHSSTVTYGGVNGSYYTKSSTRRSGSDGVAFEEHNEADSTTGQALHQVSRGLYNKGHILTRNLNSDGRVDSMQTLHNLNQDEITGFEEAWNGKVRKHLPGVSERLSGFTNNGAISSGNNGHTSRGGWALPSTEHPQPHPNPKRVRTNAVPASNPTASQSHYPGRRM